MLIISSFSPIWTTEDQSQKDNSCQTAKLFDPVGWFGPIVIKFKILLQKLWTRGVDWDEQLPQDLLEEGIAIKADLHHLHDFYYTMYSTA